MNDSLLQEVKFVKSGRVGTLTIDRPGARNGLNKAVAIRAYELLRLAYEDPELNVLVVRGGGGDFCAGAEIPKDGSREGAVYESLDPRPFEIPLLLHTMPVVTIAAIQGACAGAGFGLACACDLRVADESARFNTAFLKVGIAGDLGGSWLLPRIVGSSKARSLYFFPRKIDGAEAARLGLVDELFPPDSFDARLDAMTAELGAAPPLALRGMKRNFVYGENTDFSTYMAMETERHAHLLRSEDHGEGFRAFAEKRKPRFVGK